MSRVGKQPVLLPKEVKAEAGKGVVAVEGPKGKLELSLPDCIGATKDNDSIVIERDNDSKECRSMHGTVRSLVKNMVQGVTEGFKKELELVGVGYKAQVKGKSLLLNIGFSHPVEMAVPENLKISVPSLTRINVEGICKQEVGEFAAKIRRHYPPEPYKGKGIRYVGEEVRKKLGKALAK